MSTPTTRFRPPVSPLREWSRVIAVGLLLAAMLFVFFWPAAKPKRTEFDLDASAPIQVTIPALDRELLRSVRDASPEDRLTGEPDALAHLLEKSLGVVPTVAEALGRPSEPLPLTVLQAASESYRGAWLWYSGRLRYLSPGRSGHPVEGYKVYEGFIETDLATDGAGIVMFRTGLPSRDANVGDWVRVEGFFLKLRDSHVLPEAEKAPLLVGSEIVAEPRPWPPVATLDRAVLDTVRDGVYGPGDGKELGFSVLDAQEGHADLESSQSDPLWHLASYAKHRRNGPEDNLVWWREQPARSGRAHV